MSECTRRTFIKLLGQGTAAMGMGFSRSGSAAGTGVTRDTAAASPSASLGKLATEITANLVPLSKSVYAYVQREAPGQNNLAIANCGFVVGESGLLAIDTTAAPLQAKAFIKSADRASGKRFDRVILTHHHGDHVHALQFFPDCEVIAHEQCRVMMSKQSKSKPAGWITSKAWAEGTEIFVPMLPMLTFNNRLTLHDYADHGVTLIHPGRAHTVGDTLVYIPNEKIIFLGDIGFFGVTPLAGNGYVSEWINVCDKILNMNVEKLVPGHGDVGSKKDLAAMRDYYSMLMREARRGRDAGFSPGRTASKIDLGLYASWTEPERVADNVARIYSELDGTITPDADMAGMAKAREEYRALRRLGC